MEGIQMSEIKSVSNKTVSSVVDNQSSAPTQTTSSTAPVEAVATQELTKDGKIAKATESIISGEAVRQALLSSYKSAEKPVEIQGSASEKIQHTTTDEAKRMYSMRNPTEAQKKEIADTIRAGDKQKAIDLTLKYYGIDSSAASSIKYDQHMSEIASFDPATKEIKLRTDAFYSQAQISPDKLASVLYHQNTHARHNADPKEELGKTDQGASAEEIEIFDENISRAQAAGIQQSVIDELEYYRRIHYRSLNPENKQKIDKGQYDDVK
jgi:hypothetical protein